MIDRPYPGECCYGNNNTLQLLVTMKICCAAGLPESEVCSLMCAVFMVYTHLIGKSRGHSSGTVHPVVFGAESEPTPMVTSGVKLLLSAV